MMKLSEISCRPFMEASDQCPTQRDIGSHMIAARAFISSSEGRYPISDLNCPVSPVAQLNKYVLTMYWELSSVNLDAKSRR